MNFDPTLAALWVLPFLIAVVFHEWAHGYVASRLGDDTAERAGRLTLNPLAHIDPIGTIVLPLMLLWSGAPMFGWAKPVPVAFHRLRNPLRDMVWVAAAGPLMNLAVAVASALLRALILQLQDAAPEGAAGGFLVAEPLALMCQLSLRLNLVLAVFNMLPIPPLDGGRVAVGLLPRRLGAALAQIEPYGFFIVVALLWTNVLGVVLGPVIHLLLRLIGAVVPVF
ncbi:MAG: site-2 protease family protein [Deltaproteobacteria bacterium]|nr:site-2 protease family protein [Deltaproteobacteria bacterium]